MDRVDRLQRRFPVLGIPIAVIYKYVDDQGAYLAAILTYYAFIAIFPILLLASSILGFVLQGRPELQDAVLSSALSQFPIIGEELGRPEGLRGSTTAVVVGSLTALYGAMGLGTAIQNAVNAAWAVPRNSRPNPFLIRLRSLLLLLVAGIAVLAVTTVSVLGSSTEVFGPSIGTGLRWAFRVATVLVMALMLTALFRLAAARGQVHGQTVRSALPGALVVAALWQVLQHAGTVYVRRILDEASDMNQTFGLVLGLLALIYLASVCGVLGMEVNVVLARRFWPRALLTPFTDAVDLTEADRRAYAAYARAQRHKGFERVEVVFEDRAQSPDEGTGSRPDQTTGPVGSQAEPPGADQR